MTDPKSRQGFVPTLQTGKAHPHPEPIGGEQYSAVELMPGNRVVVLDQRKLPQVERYEFFTRPEEVAESIRSMMIRGAPAIGVCAAYGMVAAASIAQGDEASFVTAMRAADALLRATRPTAVNLAWALDRMKRVSEEARALEPRARTERVAAEARAIHEGEVEACRALGALGAPFVPDGATILTHCNAGALATGGYGTALGVIRAARDAGKKVRVLACETRPYLQGARLTAWELAKDQIPVEVITDSMAAHFMGKKGVDLVIVGADRVARNGDVANKIGTYGLACIAAAHEVPFYVAAPWSTVDLGCPNGDAIPIEQRDERELSHFAMPDGTRVQIVPDGVRVRNPSFDVTPHALVTAIITERGVVQPVSEGELATLATQ
jgi:methylthioribose-1-phosphate isomerase